MAKITPFQKPQEPDMKEYKKKLFRHRAGQGMKILVCAAVVLGIVLGMWIYAQNKTYLNYEVLASVERTDTLNTQYAEYNGKILKYSRDGISCVNLKNEAVWSQTYNMHMPILDVCRNAVVVADCQGNSAYVFNEQGLQVELTTLLPIQQVCISAQGVTALLLNDSDASWIALYDNEGTKLTDTRCRLEETGQPLSVSISSDGAKVAVSYLQVQGGSVDSCIVFYNFGPVGGNFVDKIVASKVYKDTVIPRIEYMGDSICAAVSTEGILYYEGREIPEEKDSISEEREIYSVFFGEGETGIVVDGTPESGTKYEICIYNADGEMVFTQGTDLAYNQIKISGDDVIVFNENVCEIYSKRGTLRYSGEFGGVLADIYKGAGFRRFIVVFSDRTEEIKLI